MDIDDLEIDATRARLRHLAALRDLAFTESPGIEDGLRAVLAPRGGEEEVYFAVAPRGGGYLSVSLVLVVDEAFLRENLDAILEVTSRFDAAISLGRDGALEEGEVYLNLSLRIFLAGLCEEVLELALENLRAAREALGEEFP